MLVRFIKRLILSTLWSLNRFWHAIVYIKRPRSERRKDILPRIFTEKPIPPEGTFCIFVAWQKQSLDPNFLSYIKTLSQNGLHVLVVNNGLLSAELRGEVESCCWRYIERQSPNQGWDFGAYRCGFFYLKDIVKSHSVKLDRVLFCNDSVLILPQALSVFLQKKFLPQPADWFGVFKWNTPHPHILSWFFSVSSRVWYSDFFEKFWRSYLPTQSRIQCITKGELGLSRTLLKKGIKPEVAFSEEELLKNLSQENFSPALLHMFPDSFIKRFNGMESDLPIAFKEVLSTQTKTNPMHLWQIQGVLRGWLPFIKKDLFFRSIYSREQLESFFDNLSSSVDSEFLLLIKKSILSRDPQHLPLKKKLLMRFNLI